MVLALAWMTGGGSVLVGCADISLYRLTASEIGQAIDREPGKSPADQAQAHERVESYTAALDHAKDRKFPLSVAAFLVGAAMVVFAQRAMVGREWARGLLVQLTIAHGVLVGLDYVLLPEVRVAYAAWASLGSELEPSAVLRVLAVATGVSLLTSGAIVLGLTRRGSLAYCATVERQSQT